MSKLSDIYSTYKAVLDISHDEYIKNIKERAKATRKFYDDFLERITLNLGAFYSNPERRQKVHEIAERFFGTRDIHFVAIDGSSDKNHAFDFISFYGGAYGAKGVIRMNPSGPKVEYIRWSFDRDVSMVAFVPVPYSKLVEVTDPSYIERFTYTESEKIDIANIHNQAMQLAEIYLAVNMATSSIAEKPQIILLDNSLSTLLGTCDQSPRWIDLRGYPFDRRELRIQDIVIAQSHPYSPELGVPSNKKYQLHRLILSEAHRHKTTKIDLESLSKENGLDLEALRKGVESLKGYELIKSQNGSTVKLSVDPRESWEYTKSLFSYICKRLFIDKEPEALRFKTKIDGLELMRWMSPSDMKFLMGVGLRWLIEACWEEKILLTGIVKDSESRYFSRNYLGACRTANIYPGLREVKVGALPPTDRGLVELLPNLDSTLEAPVATIEFDSCFTTLHSQEVNDREVVMGLEAGPGEFMRPERLFLRSLGIFFIKRKPESLMMGHAIFVDRLAYPELDKQNGEYLETKSYGRVYPFIYKDNSVLNVGQALTYYLLNILTRNHFPDAIGYPDPLHKADMGAKSLRRRVKGLLESSEWKFRANPLYKTFREIRQMFGR
jgi:hypothetical protein